MKHVMHDIVLSRAPMGPLAAHLAAFVTWSEARGYARYSRYRQVLLAAEFSRWLARHRLSTQDISSLAVARYLDARARRRRRHRSDAGALTQVLRFLRDHGVVPAERIGTGRPTPVARLVAAYETYLRNERALAPMTIHNYGPFVHRFLVDRFATGAVRLSRVSAHEVVGFVQRQAAHLHPKRAKVLTAALRSFLRYAQARGHLTRDLTGAVPTVAQWTRTSPPRAIAAAAVRQVLASIDRRTAIGRRDYALLLLLARLGLRAGEVVRLELDDLDWTAGHVRVRGKGARVATLPLPADVGAALATYLRQGRPSHGSRRVFMRARAPWGGFVGSQAVDAIVRHRLIRARVTAPTRGAHQFRHALATEMLRQGASLTEIGEVLRHHRPQTTAIYTAVDLAALRTPALPWPGGAR
jgi:site-specific recombinase XerD